MLIDSIIREARPYLVERKIKDAVLGLSLIGIELDNEDIGLAYMLRNHLPPGCSVFGFAQDIIGSNAYEVAQLASSGTDDAQRGVGVAVLTAGSRQLALQSDDNSEAYFGLDVQPNDVVGMIGWIPPVAAKFAKKAQQLFVFDEGVSLGNEKGPDYMKPMAEQHKLLPQCDLAVITGSTFINHTIDNLLKVCVKAREVVLVGSSTPMYPEAFTQTKVSVLAGSWWDSHQKESLFKKISLSGGIHHVQPAMLKMSVRVKK